MTDDMEALIERVALPWLEEAEQSFDTDELTKAGQAVRAFLKAYQERGRALEEAADSFARIQTYVGGRNIDFSSAFVRAEYGEKRARAALNQKGKSHD
jgi:uncharacterized protein YukE